MGNRGYCLYLLDNRDRPGDQGLGGGCGCAGSSGECDRYQCRFPRRASGCREYRLRQEPLPRAPQPWVQMVLPASIRGHQRFCAGH